MSVGYDSSLRVLGVLKPKQDLTQVKEFSV